MSDSRPCFIRHVILAVSNLVFDNEDVGNTFFFKLVTRINLFISIIRYREGIRMNNFFYLIKLGTYKICPVYAGLLRIYKN